MPNVHDLNQIPLLIAAVGALGIAAYGAVESLGKTLFVFDIPRSKGPHRAAGLPYVGFHKVQALLGLVGPALKASYGDDYATIVQQQYRAGRGKGQAPETIRQGVRLGLPFLTADQAKGVIASTWGMPDASAVLLANALTAPADDGKPAEAQALAARFATALDTRVQAVFDIAEEVYETRAQFWAALVALGLALGYQGITSGWDFSSAQYGNWLMFFTAGLVAVPLAPAAKDLSTSLSDALSALGKIRGGGK